ncbi:hypothetical protein [Rhizobium oryzicola]|uniref:DUF3299 domain-containing protein n=1 Tax=Rhizobium oryzicola TaxID=1232668 RepID=A0ABT8SPV6_9HYPH|nr:hypothetical protein [Rhizobium oryzicola]MDO1580547.1 hypothetical protein [Rhizobium oryzicola]
MSRGIDVLHFDRRTFLSTIGLAFATVPFREAYAATTQLSFGELYGKVSVLGLEFSDKVKTLTGKPVAMRGFMAPPLKAEAAFFVLTEIPMSLCPFCSSDADWPDNIVVVYLGAKQTFTQPNQLIEVQGQLDMGSWIDPETGFVSRLRIRDASFRMA